MMRVKPIRVILWGLAANSLCVAAQDASVTTLPVLRPEVASYDPRGGRNLAEEVRVDPIRGEFRYQETDLSVAGAVSAPVLQRFYRTPGRHDTVGMFGRGWRNLFERRLTALSGESCLFTDEWGVAWVFKRQDDGHWWADRGPARRIEKQAAAMVLHEADGRVWRFDSAGYLVAVGVRAGWQLTVERDPDRPSVVRSVHDSWKNSIVFETNADGLVVGVTGSNGRQVAYAYRQGLLVEVRQDEDIPVRYGYNRSSGLLSEVTLPDGSTLNVQSDTAGRVLDLSGRGIVRRTYRYAAAAEEGWTSQVARTDGLDNITRWRIGDRGRRVEMKNPVGGTVTLDNDEQGRPARLSMSESLVWQWKRDGKGRLTEIVRPQGETTRFAYSGSRLRPDRIESRGGSVTRFEYDEFDRPVGVGIASLAAWQWQYDKSGRFRQLEDYHHGRYRFEYDDQGRVSAAILPSGTPVQIQRDKRGYIVSAAQRGGPTVRFERDATGRVTRVDDGGEWLRLEYNGAGNLTGFFGSQGYQRRFYYAEDGLPAALQRENERVLRFVYDAERNCVAVRRPDRTAMHMAREAGGGVTVLDAVGLARWSAAYDRWSRPVTFRRDGGRQNRVGYDASGRICSVEPYSTGGLALRYGSDGRLSAVETSERQFRFAFDPLGRVQAIVERSFAKRDAFEYDRNNRLVRRTTPAWIEQYRYDPYGRLTALILRGLGTRTLDLRYNEAGLLDTILYPNGARSVFDYDEAYRLTRASTSDAKGKVFAMPVDYATSSRLVTATGRGSSRFTYRYDSNLALLETVSPDGVRDVFTYDSLGNRAWAQTGDRRTFFRHDALGRPTEVGPTRYLYLRAGRPTPPLSSSMVALTVDDWERVVALRRGDGLTVEYGYLPDGRVARRTLKGRTFVFDWDGPRLRSVFDGQGRRLVSIYSDPAFGLVLAVVMGDRIYFCHPDAFGYPAWLTDEQGNPVGPPDDFPFRIRAAATAPLRPTWEGLPPAIRLPEEGLQLVRGYLCEPRTGSLLSPNLSRFVDSANPFNARRVARPFDPTGIWDQLAEVIGRVEELEASRPMGRWQGNVSADVRLADWVRLVQRPECFEAQLIRRAFRHDSNPDHWLDAALLGSVVGEQPLLPAGPFDPRPSPAAHLSDFSPLGPIPYDWDRQEPFLRAAGPIR